jgi:hypothetical protein
MDLQAGTENDYKNENEEEDYKEFGLYWETEI